MSASGSGRKRLCACGCGTNVTRGTELRHQQGKGPYELASAILRQNWTLIREHKNRKSSRQSVKHQLVQVGRRAPIQNSLSASHSLTGGAPSPDNIPGHFPDDDYPMDDSGAGPSGVHHDTPPYSPESPPPIRHSPLHDNVVSALSTTRRSRRVAERVDRIGRQRWGTNHVHFFMDERRDDPAKEEGAADDLVAGGDEDRDDIYVDQEFWDDEDDVMAVAEPGQEGISVWDILGQSFLQEVSQIGMFFVECF